MVRIIPWNLPPVNGGSVGGYTPAPTPPVPTNYPYDLDNIQISTDFGFTKAYESLTKVYRTGVLGKVAISGVVINDSTSVASVIAHVHVAPGTDNWIDSVGEHQIIEADVDVEVGSIMSAVGGEVDVTNVTKYGMTFLDNFYSQGNNKYSTLASTTSTITVTGITVYNSNGVALQEWTP